MTTDPNTARKFDRIDAADLYEHEVPGQPGNRGCESERGLPVCTREAGHPGQHVATATGGLVVATWPAEETSDGA